MPDQMTTPHGYSWMRRPGGARQATMHLLPDEPQPDPSADPGSAYWLAACGATAVLWIYPLAGNVPCVACLAAGPVPSAAVGAYPHITAEDAPLYRSPQPPAADAGPYQGDEADTTDDNFHFDSFSDLLPEGSMPVRGVKVIEYLDADGDTAYEWRRFGTADVVQLVGLLEFTKLRMVMKAQYGDDEE